MTTIVPPIGIRISGIQSLETAKVTIKNGAGIAFIFNQKNPKYFDIPVNRWKLDKLVPSVLEANKLCKTLNDLDS